MIHVLRSRMWLWLLITQHGTLEILDSVILTPSALNAFALAGSHLPNSVLPAAGSHSYLGSALLSLKKIIIIYF